MALARARSRIARMEKTLGVVCPACAARPRMPGVLLKYEGRLTDGNGNDIDPAWLEPCERCGRGGNPAGGVRVVAGLDPAAL